MKITYMPLIGSRIYLPEGSLPIVLTSIEVRDEVSSPAVSEISSYAYGEARYSPVLNRMGFGWSQVRNRHSVELTHATIDDYCGPRPTIVQRLNLAGL